MVLSLSTNSPGTFPKSSFPVGFPEEVHQQWPSRCSSNIWAVTFFRESGPPIPQHWQLPWRRRQSDWSFLWGQTSVFDDLDGGQLPFPRGTPAWGFMMEEMMMNGHQEWDPCDLCDTSNKSKSINDLQCANLFRPSSS
ncbi:hypothetical protein Bbelb_407730 [Branchiostoma belcheri]|nr:hypothetical protein Bbelb_407730 [Branchiostoma belcheri]